MTQPAHGEWYLATDGKWYRWPDPTPHDAPPAAAEPGPPAPPAPPAPPPGYEPQGFAAPGYGAPADPGAPGYGAPATGYGIPSGYVQGYGDAPAPPPDRNGSVLAIAGGVLVAIGSVLPWAKLESSFITISRSGMDGGDGFVTLIVGVAAAVVGLGAILRWSLPRWTVWVPLPAAALAGVIALLNYADVKSAGDEFQDATGIAPFSVGSGIYAILLGALVGVVGGVLMVRRPSG